MKRILPVLLTLVLVLSACAAPAESQEGSDAKAVGNTEAALPLADSGDASDAALPDPEALAESWTLADPWTLTEPPSLNVSTGDVQVTAQQYGYQWLHTPMPDGTMTSVIACGIHPLDNARILADATLSLTSAHHGEGPRPVYTLDFGDIPPETVTVRSWPAQWLGDDNASEHYEDWDEVSVQSEDDLFFIAPLVESDFVYEISASWGEVGRADYAFVTSFCRSAPEKIICQLPLATEAD